MRFKEIIREDQEESSPAIEDLKAQLSAKIKQLPTDPATMKLLAEIEDLLSSVGSGSRAQIISGALEKIQDPDVNKAQKLLAKYVLSLDASPEDRRSMLDAWKADQLVNVASLLKPGERTVADIVRGYDSNPAIKELTDDLSQIAALGQGKGEFLLSVFSKKITKAAPKGDLYIDGVGTLEVKTREGGAGRFYDQQVKPTQEYQNATNKFRDAFQDEIKQEKLTASTGINITGLVKLYASLPTEKRDTFRKGLLYTVLQLFPEAKNMAELFVNSVMAGNESQAKQRYAVANLNNYMAQKDDIGILMIDLTKDPYSFVFFTDNKSLNAGGLRLHSSTAYPISNDPRYIYPQIHVQSTKQQQEEL